MITPRPAAAGEPVASGRLRTLPEDFRVDEELGFAPAGEGEHVFLHLEKRGLNTADVARRISTLSGVHPRDIGYCGMKDRHAVTRQWFSVRMAGRAEPDWRGLAQEHDLRVMEVARHLRKLKRGVHRANRFRLVLRDVCGDRAVMEQRLQQIRASGAPNYFGEQRFGRDGSTLAQARDWMGGGGRRISRNKRGLFLSALRADLFNRLLADRVEQGDWNAIRGGDMCILRGTRSQFVCKAADADIARRCASGDIHPALPLWGRRQAGAPASMERSQYLLRDHRGCCEFLVSSGLELAWRPARLLPDDICWQFCDDGNLQLEFRLGAGSYATALLGEFVRSS